MITNQILKKVINISFFLLLSEIAYSSGVGSAADYREICEINHERGLVITDRFDEPGIARAITFNGQKKLNYFPKPYDTWPSPERACTVTVKLALTHPSLNHMVFAVKKSYQVHDDPFTIHYSSSSLLITQKIEEACGKLQDDKSVTLFSVGMCEFEPDCQGQGIKGTFFRTGRVSLAQATVFLKLLHTTGAIDNYILDRIKQKIISLGFEFPEFRKLLTPTEFAKNFCMKHDIHKVGPYFAEVVKSMEFCKRFLNKGSVQKVGSYFAEVALKEIDAMFSEKDHQQEALGALMLELAGLGCDSEILVSLAQYMDRTHKCYSLCGILLADIERSKADLSNPDAVRDAQLRYISRLLCLETTPYEDLGNAIRAVYFGNRPGTDLPVELSELKYTPDAMAGLISLIAKQKQELEEKERRIEQLEAQFSQEK